MLTYVAVVFPQVDQRCRGDIVGRTLDVFMARLHAWRPGQEWLEPEALGNAPADVALKRAGGAVTAGRGGGGPRGGRPSFPSPPAGVRGRLQGPADRGEGGG